MSVPDTIHRLVEQFHTHRDAYRAGQYNETQVRREFIDPMWKALGWDIDNAQGYAETYKDVIHEDAIKIGGVTKAPDYCFRIGGVRKFFLEAKKPSIAIADDIGPAFQLRRYAWSAKLPLSVLTDFEELAVYDCRVKPDKADKASTARVMYLTYDGYIDRWDEIASVFTREAILKGAFDKYADSHKAKRGTAEVDAAFLSEIESWRDMLARNIAIRNPQLDQRGLNHAIQCTIDRIVFLRICEDRAIEDYGRLMALLSGDHVYERLGHLFRQADERYNSGLFHFRREKGREGLDDWTLGLAIDDKPLKDIIRNLYYPESPYEFAVLPADILGQVYEQFLGKVIRLTAGHRAVVEDKPEVKKAGGVYYTPTYIVDYIVKHTVGRLLEGKSPRDTDGSKKGTQPLRVLDPACGSGSFLIGAYQFLLDWHRDWYANNDPEKWAATKRPPIRQIASPVPTTNHQPQTTAPQWALTTEERKRILLTHIHGVDIDPQAVEVTKLSLLLKVLEGENAAVLQQQLKLFQERALPDLSTNIKCGNSLIGPDFYQGKQLDAFNEEEAYRINAFDWNAEFPQAMQSGGFDAVIGNPPYIRIQTMKEWAPIEVEFYKERYKSAASGNYDIYVVFIEKGLSLLNKDGRLGFICPNKFFNAKYGHEIRRIVAEGKQLEHVVHFGDQQVFSGPTTYTCLLFLSGVAVPVCRLTKPVDIQAWRTDGECPDTEILASTITALPWNFLPHVGDDLRRHTQQIQTTLGEIAHIFVGLQTSADDIFVVPADSDIEMELTRPFLLTGNLHAYSPAPISARLLFPYDIQSGQARLIPAKTLQDTFPNGWAYLSSHRERLMNRERGKWQHEQWYAFGRSQNLTQMEAPKLIIQVTAQDPTVLLDEQGLHMTGGGSGPFYGIRPRVPDFSIHFLLGILNSSLFGWVVRSQSTNLRGGYVKFSKQYIESAPIPVGCMPVRHDKMVTLVQRMLDLHKRLQTAKAEHERITLQRQIAATDTEIDHLVYELYELTPEEIAIVEGESR